VDEFREMLERLCESRPFENVETLPAESEPNSLEQPERMFGNPVEGIEAGFRGVRTKVEVPKKRGQPAIVSREVFPGSVLSGNSEGESKVHDKAVDHFAIARSSYMREPEQDFLKLVEKLKESRQAESEETKQPTGKNVPERIPLPKTDNCENSFCLPESMEVLLVDDENILRKLFIRSVHRIAPAWKITEAHDATKALELVGNKTFDVIFMDQYMPSPSLETPMLGTQAVQKLRSLGVCSLICGLSANQMRDEFIEAGADWFLLKPFPCDKELLYKELSKFCSCRDDRCNNHQQTKQ
jgi:CheY-like chemotaxis protein